MSFEKRRFDLRKKGDWEKIAAWLAEGEGEEQAMAETDLLRAAFEKWARGVGFEDFEVKDEDADYLDLEYCDDDVELVWCAFAEGAENG